MLLRRNVQLGDSYIEMFLQQVQVAVQGDLVENQPRVQRIIFLDLLLGWQPAIDLSKQ
jgi:hypothetical protein